MKDIDHHGYLILDMKAFTDFLLVVLLAYSKTFNRIVYGASAIAVDKIYRYTKDLKRMF